MSSLFYRRATSASTLARASLPLVRRSFRVVSHPQAHLMPPLPRAHDARASL